MASALLLAAVITGASALAPIGTGARALLVALAALETLAALYARRLGSAYSPNGRAAEPRITERRTDV